MINKSLNTFNDVYDTFLKAHMPEETIIHFDDHSLTLNDLSTLSDIYICTLAEQGVKPGSCIGYTMPNCPEIFALVIAASRMGACVVPVFHMIPDMGKAAIFKNSRVDLVITTSQQFTSLKESASRAGAQFRIVTIDQNNFGETSLSAKQAINDKILNKILSAKIDASMPLLISASSGTTGTPKSVIWTQSNTAALLKSSTEMARPLAMSGKTGVSSIIAFPLASAGVMNCIGFLFAGVRLIFSSDVSPVRFLQLLTKWKADSMSAPPAYYEAILSLPMLATSETSSVRWIFTGMDFISTSLLNRLRDKFPEIKSMINGYGLIETTNVFMVCIANREHNEFSNPTNRMMLVGGIGNQIDIRNNIGESVITGMEGELFIKGTSVVRGYLGNPVETSENFIDGWFRTGDIVRNEGKDIVTLLGRKKYLIKRGGKSVSPISVQNHINTLSSVKNSSVVGVPHPLYGEMVWAFIEPIQGTEIKLKDVMKHCRSELVNYYGTRPGKIYR